jgi:hypothetical protein
MTRPPALTEPIHDGPTPAPLARRPLGQRTGQDHRPDPMGRPRAATSCGSVVKRGDAARSHGLLRQGVQRGPGGFFDHTGVGAVHLRATAFCGAR